MVQFLLTGIITQVKQSMNNCWLFKITRLITSSLIHFRSKTNIKTTLDIFVGKFSSHPVIFLGQYQAWKHNSYTEKYIKYKCDCSATELCTT